MEEKFASRVIAKQVSSLLRTLVKPQHKQPEHKQPDRQGGL
jgi:hypothetical protein